MPASERCSVFLESGMCTCFLWMKFRLAFHPDLWHFDPLAPAELHTDSGSVVRVLFLFSDSTLKNTNIRESVPQQIQVQLHRGEQECLAVVFVVMRFWSYLYGRPSAIVAGHHSLCWLVNLRDPSACLTRWVLQLQGYDFTVSCKSCWRQADADCLLRLMLPTMDCDADSFDQYIASLESAFPDTNTFRTEQKKQITCSDCFLLKRNQEPIVFAHMMAFFAKRMILLYAHDIFW